MKQVNFSELRSSLKRYLDEIEYNHETLIVNRRVGKSTVIIPLDEYNSIMETMYPLKSMKNDYGIKDKEFWNWWHRKGKPKGDGKDIGTKGEAYNIFTELVTQGASILSSKIIGVGVDELRLGGKFAKQTNEAVKAITEGVNETTKDVINSELKKQ